MPQVTFISIEKAISRIANGQMVIVIDDEDRDNEGEIIMAAHFATEEHLSEMHRITHSTSMLAVTNEFLPILGLDEHHFSKLPINQKYVEIPTNTQSKTKLAQNQAKAIQDILQKKTPSTGPLLLLNAKRMGVLKRAGHTEAATDLARLSGFDSTGILCKCTNKKGAPLKTNELLQFSKQHNIPIMSIRDLIKYRNSKESFINKVSSETVQTKHGPFQLICYEDILNHKQHYALYIGGPFTTKQRVLVRVHSECLTGDIFGSLRCDCGPQLDTAMSMIQKAERGVILYMRQEGRGIGLVNKMKAYKLQETGHDTVDANIKLGFKADLRDYGVGAQILLDLGIRNIKLITNNPKKIIGLEGYGLSICDRVPIQIDACEHNKLYLDTKKHRLGHIF